MSYLSLIPKMRNEIRNSWQNRLKMCSRAYMKIIGNNEMGQMTVPWVSFTF